MIKNDKQYQITKNLLIEFKSQLEKVGEESVDPIYRKIEEDAIKSQIIAFEKEMEEYDLLKQGNVNYIYVDSITNLHEILIKGRIIKGWTHAELAKRLDLKEQQIQRYEFCNYSTASIARISQVAAVLDIDMNPIKIKFLHPKIFSHSAKFNDEQISNAYNKIKQNRCLLSL